MHIAIVTAKGGNQTMTDKNLVDIAGKPCVYWPISAAQETGIIDDVYVTTECPKIKKVSEGFGAKVINRPDTLAQPLSNHGDVIVHAVKSIKLDAGRSIETVTILLGNTVMITSDDINTAIHKTMSDEAIDSCMTVWKAQDDHPYRAMVLGENGYLRSYSRGMTPDTNRQSYPDVYFYDRTSCICGMNHFCGCKVFFVRRNCARVPGPGGGWDRIVLRLKGYG